MKNLWNKKLYEFRGCKVLLGADLAEVYGYELKAFNQQVKRNIERFQNDMMFQLSDNEVEYCVTICDRKYKQQIP